MKKSLQIISFFTEGSPYEEEAKTLKNSCEQFDLSAEITQLESAGSWEKNVALKPRFLLEKWKKSDRPLLWVDADAAFLQKPNFDLFNGIDFSVRFMEIFQDQPEYAVNTATLFIDQTKEAKKLLEQWVKECDLLCKDADAPFADQISLSRALQKNKMAKVLPMPVAYCKIYDLDTFFIDDDKVVIEQRQASRLYKGSLV